MFVAFCDVPVKRAGEATAYSSAFHALMNAVKMSAADCIISVTSSNEVRLTKSEESLFNFNCCFQMSKSRRLLSMDSQHQVHTEDKLISYPEASQHRIPAYSVRNHTEVTLIPY